jgi:hypothetical protein
MASYANLIADQGADFDTSVTLEDERSDPIDLTGYIVSGQIRRTYKSATSYDFEVNIMSALDGIIGISLPATVSAAMRSGRYVYDIYASSSTINKSYKVLEGTLELVPSVTRVEAP